MKKSLFKNNLIILLLLFLIGLFVHSKSFQMVPYGDDWKFIYNYYTHEEKSLNFSNFPGIFSYMAPYGPAILSIGLIHQFFGNTYFIYYLVPLIFRTLTAFFLFLTLKNISQSMKKNNNFICFLPAVLFIVSMTGIQAIDWSMNMNIFIALFIFSISLFFQSKYYINSGKVNLIVGFLLAIFSIIFAPTRFTPFVVIFPLIDVVLLISKRDKFFYFSIIVKNIIFGILTYFFLQIGIFGEPGNLNNTSRIAEFIAGATADVQLSLGMFMHWIGITILPVYPSSDIYKTSIIGVLFLALLIWTFFKSRNEWIIIGSIIFFITLGIMWIISPLQIADSALRYLIVPFFSLCFLIGILLMFTGKFKNLFKIILILIILMQIYSVNSIYSYWVDIGRSSIFMENVDKQIMSHFPTPINEPKMIYLDFDNGAVLQSVVFGIGYRVAIFSETKGINYFPLAFTQKTALIEAIREEINKGVKKEKIINNVSAFQFKDRVFTDITSSMQKELKVDLDNF